MSVRESASASSSLPVRVRQSETASASPSTRPPVRVCQSESGSAFYLHPLVTPRNMSTPTVITPPSILRSVPEAIKKRLSNISSDKNAFDSAVPPYQEAQQKSGYHFKLQYNPQPSKPKRSRSRNIIWFNPPYNSTVSTNIGYKFLQAVDDCFTPDHPLRKIFNRNTLKLSYSCMPNVKSIISSHNKSVLKDQSVTSASQVDKDCNCRKKDTCPLSGKCLTTNGHY